jgi:hypothetical protein
MLDHPGRPEDLPGGLGNEYAATSPGHKGAVAPSRFLTTTLFFSDLLRCLLDRRGASMVYPTAKQPRKERASYSPTGPDH